MEAKRWIVPAVLVGVLFVPLFLRVGIGPARASRPEEPVAAPVAETCDQACTAIASCGRDAAAALGLAPQPDPKLAPPLDVPAARAACLKPCIAAATEAPAYAETVGACSECVKTFDCRDVKDCLATCRPDPAVLAGR